MTVLAQLDLSFESFKRCAIALEIEKLCAAGPARLKEWGKVFVNDMGVEDSVGFLALL